MRKRDSDGRSPVIGDPGITGATGNPMPGLAMDPATGQPYPGPGQPGGVPNCRPGMVAGYNGSARSYRRDHASVTARHGAAPGGHDPGQIRRPAEIRPARDHAGRWADRKVCRECPGRRTWNERQSGRLLCGQQRTVCRRRLLYRVRSRMRRRAVQGQNQYPGNPVNSQAGGVSPAYGTAPGSNGMPPGSFQQPGMQTGPGQGNAAAQMIQQILTQPRPGGMPAANPGMGAAMGRRHSRFRQHGRFGKHHGLQRPVELWRLGVRLRSHQGQAAIQSEQRRHRAIRGIDGQHAWRPARALPSSRWVDNQLPRG